MLSNNHVIDSVVRIESDVDYLARMEAMYQTVVKEARARGYTRILLVSQSLKIGYVKASLFVKRMMLEGIVEEEWQTGNPGFMVIRKESK